MKTFHRTSLPDIVYHNNQKYMRSVTMTTALKDGLLAISSFKRDLLVKVCVLPSQLRNKMDANGKPYKPTEWIFIKDK